MAQFSIRNQEAIQETFQEACARHEMLILVTPYLRFESSFVRMEADCLHIGASMSHEDATYGLRTTDLHLRFPHRVHFLDGATKLLGFGTDGGKRTLRLTIPSELQDDDHRGAYRVDRPGRVNVTFSTRKYQLLTGTLVNMSVTGARIHSLRDLEIDEVRVEDTLPVTIPLTSDIYINSQAKVRYIQNRSIGIEFRPVLPNSILETLQRWIFQKRQEDHERDANRANLVAGGHVSTSQTSIHRGLILVSSDTVLESRLRDLLTELPPLARIPANMQALKGIDPVSQTLVLFHVQTLGLDERRRLKMMVESLQGKLPFVLLGTGVESPVLLEVGTELRAAAAYVLGPLPSPFFKRLVQGILRRHFEEGSKEVGKESIGG